MTATLKEGYTRRVKTHEKSRIAKQVRVGREEANGVIASNKCEREIFFTSILFFSKRFPCTDTIGYLSSSPVVVLGCLRFEGMLS